MEHLLVLGFAGFTSLGAYIVGVRGLGLPRPGLAAAFAQALEVVGVVVGFWALNLAVGTITVLAARLCTGGFVSLYHASDITLLGLSLLQGLTFQYWRQMSHPPRCARR